MAAVADAVVLAVVNSAPPEASEKTCPPNSSPRFAIGRFQASLDVELPTV
jgi:hypothetical protein